MDRSDISALHIEPGDPRSRAVFLHGFGSDLHSWDALWPEVGAQLPALRYDLRGFGRSGPADQPYRHADDLLAVLDRVGIERCDLIGVSQGGAVAINFALDHPDRVRRLVLISPALVAWEWSDAWRRLWRPIVACARAGDLDQARRLWWQHPLFASTRASPGGAALLASIQRFSGQPWLHDAHRLMTPDIERLHRLAAPTLLLTGARDLEDFRVIAELIAANSALVERIDEPQLGHLLHLEAPQRCAQRILAFLAADADPPTSHAQDNP